MAICRGDFPWESAASIFRGFFPVGLPWEFAAAICRKKLSWLFAVSLICVSKQTFFLCEQTIFLCKQIFVNSVSFHYCRGS